MNTQLEDLSNELLLDILDYIKTEDLVSSFWNLNQHFNNLIRSLKYLSLIVKKTDTLPSSLFSQQIVRVVIVTLIDIQLDSFVNLRSLILNIATENHIKQIQPHILPKLAYLSIPIVFESRVTKQLASEIFSNRFIFLRYTDLNLINIPNIFSWSQSPSLHSLHLSSSNINIIPLLLQSCPQLIHLQIRIIDEHDFDPTSLLNLSEHPLRNFLFIQSQPSTFVFNIFPLFSIIPNVKRIDFRLCTRSFIDLIQLISKSFSQLTCFDCHIIEYPNKDEHIDIHQIRNIHSCYSNIQCTLREDCFCLYTTKRTLM
ncbi:hypothetical protein I4U23_019735 [Adineta vaga]|nr:hypothetical protein I4U23_019735 [Adineta vaga]